MMEVRPIRNEADPQPGTPASDRFDVLSDLIAAREARHHPIPADRLTPPEGGTRAA